MATSLSVTGGRIDNWGVLVGCMRILGLRPKLLSQCRAAGPMDDAPDGRPLAIAGCAGLLQQARAQVLALLPACLPAFPVSSKFSPGARSGSPVSSPSVHSFARRRLSSPAAGGRPRAPPVGDWLAGWQASKQQGRSEALCLRQCQARTPGWVLGTEYEVRRASTRRDGGPFRTLHLLFPGGVVCTACTPYLVPCPGSCLPSRPPPPQLRA